MGTSERREREKAALRQKILDAGRAMLAKDGFEAMTMRKLAQRIEYTPGALYAYFADKDALVRTICANDFDAFTQAFRAPGAVEEPIERLRALGRAYAQFALEHPEPYRVLFVQPAPQNVVEEAKNPDSDAYQMLEASVRHAIELGHFAAWRERPHLVAQTLWAGMHGVVTLEIWRTPEQLMPFEAIADRVDAMVDVVLAGLEVAGPPAKRTRKAEKGAPSAKRVAGKGAPSKGALSAGAPKEAPSKGAASKRARAVQASRPGK